MTKKEFNSLPEDEKLYFYFLAKSWYEDWRVSLVILTNSEKELIKQGEIIRATKELKTRTNFSLAICKKVVEKYRDENPQTNKQNN